MTYLEKIKEDIHDMTAEEFCERLFTDKNLFRCRGGCKITDDCNKCFINFLNSEVGDPDEQWFYFD